jgi:hypothetical protein
MQIFLDCDGVLANFDKRFEELSGESAKGYEDKHGAKAFWKVVMSDPQFFYNLEPMPGALTLVDCAVKLGYDIGTVPIILTGCPQGNWSQPQKQLWRLKHFPDIPMITCDSKSKYQFMAPKMHNVIVDDWPKYQEIWEQNGGTFILHTSAEESIIQLEELMSKYY